MSSPWIFMHCCWNDVSIGSFASKKLTKGALLIQERLNIWYMKNLSWCTCKMAYDFYPTCCVSYSFNLPRLFDQGRRLMHMTQIKIITNHERYPIFMMYVSPINMIYLIHCYLFSTSTEYTFMLIASFDIQIIKGGLWFFIVRPAKKCRCIFKLTKCKFKKTW